MKERTRRITISLNDAEAMEWDAVRNNTVPEAIAARTMLLQSVQFLREKGLQQRRDIHLATEKQRQKQAADTYYDYSDAQ